MMTSPLYTDPNANMGSTVASSPDESAAERIRHLEDEIADLRDTVARFADLMIGEVKELRKTQAELPAIPATLSDISHPVDDGSTHSHPSSVADDARGARRPWLLAALFHVFATTIRMYLDPRYRVRRYTQMMVPALLGSFALTYFFFNYVFLVPVLSSLLERIVDFVLAILLYCVLNVEVQRYRRVLEQLAAWQSYGEKRTAVIIGGEPPTTPLEMQ